MRTNASGQRLRDDAPVLPGDDYHGELFSEPKNILAEGEVAFDGPSKIYEMAYLQGFPHITVESFPGKGVVVSYHITATVYSWDWAHRNDAWNWARERKQHIEMLR